MLSPVNYYSSAKAYSLHVYVLFIISLKLVPMMLATHKTNNNDLSL
jgi:hypothetical protein